MSEKHHHSPKDPECLDVFERLSEYLDGELTPADCRHLEEHISDCAPCVKFLDSLKATVTASNGYRASKEAAPIPDDVKQKLQAAWRAAVEQRGSK
jgi:anti-sigma factor RsiW